MEQKLTQLQIDAINKELKTVKFGGVAFEGHVYINTEYIEAQRNSIFRKFGLIP